VTPRMTDRRAAAAWMLALVSLATAWFGGAARAATLTTLYEATVPVTDTSEAARASATEQAMRIVLTKLTGNARAPVLPGAGGILDRAENYVEQFQILKDAGASGANAFKLKVTFNAEALDAAIVEAGFSRWSNERPETLLWLFVEQDGQWTPVAPGVGSEATGRLARIVTNRARDRGLPLVFPEYDMLDTEALKAGGFDGDPLAAVTNASARYAKNAIVYLTLAEVTPAIWEAQWYLAVDEETLNWQGQGGIRDLLLEEAVDAVADAIASRFATSSPAGSMQTIEIVVDGVDRPEHYAGVLTYFDELDAIEHVHVDLVGGTSIRFRLDVRGGVPEFERLIGLGRTLEAVAGSPGRYLVLD